MELIMVRKDKKVWDSSKYWSKMESQKFEKWK